MCVHISDGDNANLPRLGMLEYDFVLRRVRLSSQLIRSCWAPGDYLRQDCRAAIGRKWARVVKADVTSEFGIQYRLSRR